MRIGILIPEFPGQTHIFFWRERASLERHGVQAEIVSTRRPPSGVVSHIWSQEAMRSTWYLSPLRQAQFAAAVRGLVASPASAWARCFASCLRAEGLGARARARLLALAAAGAEVADLARVRGWAHVHSHSCGDSAHVAMFAHLLSGIPYSLTLHGALPDYGPNQREKWRHAAFGLAVTHRLVAEVRQALGEALPGTLAVAPMGVDVERFRRTESYAPHCAGPLRVFTCARLHPGKGHLDLVQAIALLRARGLDARLVIAGEDDAGGSGYHSVLVRAIADAGLSAVVRLLGAVPEERVIEELQAAHVFALASHVEALGVATMEAMAMQVPVVVTNVGGVPELVSDGVDGVLVPPREPAALADRIEQLALDSDRAAAFARAGRAKVARCFTSEHGAEVLAELLGRSTGRAAGSRAHVAEPS